LPTTKVPPPMYGQIYIMSSNPPPNTKQYEVTIGNFPTCTCVDFITMMTSSFGGRGHGCIADSALFHLAKCDILWPNKKFHSFPDMELEWNATPNEVC
jgi:hypothetical protein